MRSAPYCINVLLALIMLLTGEMLAQSTIIKLPKTDTTSNFIIMNNNNETLMKLNSDGGFCLFGNVISGNIPATGSGRRLLWYPKKGAFRAGTVSGSHWDDDSIGYNSVALGGSNIARGDYSVAMGYNNSAWGNQSVAIGEENLASGNWAIAIGKFSVASGVSSVAIGEKSVASGPWSVAVGYQTTAFGFASVALGDPVEAAGDSAVAIGHELYAGAKNSVALGNYVDINPEHEGAMVISDASNSKSRTASSGPQEMTMRFAGGYRLFSNDECSRGVKLVPGGNSWEGTSDSTKKTNFLEANGEYFLESLSKLRLGSWNFKDQDPKQFRHYGPMAQEIFHYFGKDAYGTIGNDTTLATADMDGIMMICLQALEKRTSELRMAQKALEVTIGELQKANEKIAELENLVQLQQTGYNELKGEISKMKNELKSMTESVNEKLQENVAQNR